MSPDITENRFRGTFPNELLLLTISFLDPITDHATFKTLRTVSRAASHFAAEGYFSIVSLPRRNAPGRINELASLGYAKYARGIVFPVETAFEAFEDSTKIIERMPELFNCGGNIRTPKVYSISLRAVSRIFKHCLILLHKSAPKLQQITIAIPGCREHNRNRAKYQKWSYFEADICEILRTTFKIFQKANADIYGVRLLVRYCGGMNRRSGVEPFLSKVWKAERALKQKLNALNIQY